MSRLCPSLGDRLNSSFRAVTNAANFTTIRRESELSSYATAVWCSVGVYPRRSTFGAADEPRRYRFSGFIPTAKEG